MFVYAAYLTLALINFIGATSFSLSSLSHSISFHLGWQVCKKFSWGICSGGISTVVVHVTMASLFLYPSQIWMLRKWVNWSFAKHIIVSQQVGLYLSLYVLFYYESKWLTKALGAYFFLIALGIIFIGTPSTAGGIGSSIVLHSAVSEDDNECVETAVGGGGGEHLVDFESYKVDTWRRSIAVWCTGLLSGSCAGLFALGGPPVMLFMAIMKMNSLECKATIAFSDLWLNIGRFLYILLLQSKIPLMTGVYSLSLIILTATSVVALIISIQLSTRVSQQSFYRMLVLMLTAGAALLLSKDCTKIQMIIITACVVGSIVVAIAVSILCAYCRIHGITLVGMISSSPPSRGLRRGSIDGGSNATNDSSRKIKKERFNNVHSGDTGTLGSAKHPRINSIGGVDADDITSVVTMPVHQQNQVWNFEILSGKIYAAIRNSDDDEEAAAGSSVLF